MCLARITGPLNRALPLTSTWEDILHHDHVYLGHAPFACWVSDRMAHCWQLTSAVSSSPAALFRGFLALRSPVPIRRDLLQHGARATRCYRFFRSFRCTQVLGGRSIRFTITRHSLARCSQSCSVQWRTRSVLSPLLPIVTMRNGQTISVCWRVHPLSSKFLTGASASRYFSAGRAPDSGLSLRQRANRQTVVYMIALAVAVMGLSYAAVPLYRIFCQVSKDR